MVMRKFLIKERKNMTKNINRKKLYVGLFMLILIVSVSIAVKQPPFMTLPLTVSIFIMLLQTSVNRYAFLIGGLNSIIYAIVYMCMGVYASAWFALLFSCPLQIMTFLNWKKNAYKNSTVLKSLSTKARIILSIATAICLVVVFLILYKNGNTYAILDSMSSVLGVLVTFLSLLAYKEYPFVNLISGIIAIFLNTQICINDFSYLPYLIYSIYSFICIAITALSTHKLYKVQNEN